MELTKKQKKKYRRQTIKQYFYTSAISLTIILSIGSTIQHFFNTNDFLYLGLTIPFLICWETILKQHKIEIELIEERIERRKRKNLKGDNIY